MNNDKFYSYGYVDNGVYKGLKPCQMSTEQINEAVEKALEGKLDNLDVKLEGSDLQYTLKVNGQDAGTIDIPEDQFLKDVEYNEQTKEIVFTIGDDDETTHEVRISVEDFIKPTEGLATEDWVNAQGFAKTADVEGTYATKEDLNDYAKKDEIPSVDNFVTDETLDTYKQEVAEAFGKKLDVEAYNTDKETFALKSEIPSVDNLATKEELATQKTELDNAIEFKADKTSVYTIEEVDSKIDAAKGELEGKITSVEDAQVEDLAKITELAGKLNGVENLSEDLDKKLDKSVYETDKPTFALKSELPVTQNFATKTELDTKLDKSEFETAKETFAPKGDYMEYTTAEDGRKHIILGNNDTLTGTLSDGSDGANIAMISKWDVVDLGSQKLPINLNGSKERPTYNDDKELALKKDVDDLSVETEGLVNGEKERALLAEGDIFKYIDAILKNYSLKSDEEITKLIKAGGDVVLASNVKSESGFTLTKKSDIDLNGHELNAVSNGNYGDNIVIGNGAEVVISNGEVKPAENASVANASATILVKTASASKLTLNDVKATGIHPLYVNSANEDTLVTINGGEFYTTMPLDGVDSDHMAPAVYVGKGSTGSTIGGKVIINGGTFGQKGVVNNFLLNVEDVLRKQEGKEPRDFIEVRGENKPRFINFNVQDCVSEGPNTNFVADGYTVKVIQDGDDTIYEVVKED